MAGHGGAGGPLRAGLPGGGGAGGHHRGDSEGRHHVRGQVTLDFLWLEENNIDCGQETPGYLFAELSSPLAVITLKLSCTSLPLIRLQCDSIHRILHLLSYTMILPWDVSELRQTM